MERDVQVKFETTFGSGVDPWYAKAERWARKKPFPWNHLLLGAIKWLTQIWIDAKIYNTMKSVDRQAADIVKTWEEQDDRTSTRHIVETGVFGDEGWSIQISNPIIDRGPEIPKSKLVTPSDASTMEKDEGDTTRP